MITIIKVRTRSKPDRTRIGKRITAWFHGPTLTRDLGVVVVVKVGLLMILKYAFFNHPQAENMTMPPAEVARQVLSTSTAVPSETEGNHHAQ